MTPVLEAATVILILGAPIAGRGAAAFVDASLEEETSGGSKTKHSALAAPTPNFSAGMQIAFLASALWAAQAAPGGAMLSSILLGWYLIVLSVFDVKAFILPDVLTYALLACGLAPALALSTEEVASLIGGAIAGGGCLYLVRWIHWRFTKREGLGLGDVKLFGAAGAWVGLEGLPQVLLIASLCGLIYAALAPRQGRFSKKKIPFGAGLCLAFWLTWLYGPVLSRV
jgi:leader peptidase (prepilin peptidase) / N-methyltransferase